MKTSSILDTYQTWLTHREYSPATIQKYTKALARFFADTGAGDIPTRETVAAWRDSLTEKGYTPATVNAMLAAVNDYQESIDNVAGKAIPNIIIRKTKPLGHYGRLRKAYLEMHRPILFDELVLSDKLFEHCAEIDEAARNRMELIVRSLAKQYGVTEQLKAENQMEWVRQMNACKAQAEEVVKAELIYD